MTMIQQKNANTLAAKQNEISSGKKVKKLESASKTELETARAKKRENVTAQRSMDLLSKRETKQTSQVAQKKKLHAYKFKRLMLGIYALCTAAVVYQGMSNMDSKGAFRNEAAVVALVLSMGLMRYSMNHTKKELITNQIKSLRKQHWGYKPTPSQAWATVVGKTR